MAIDDLLDRSLVWKLGVGAGAFIYLAPDLLTAGPIWCPFRRFTGLPCPTCGLTTSCVATMHGQVADAVHAHPFGPVLVVLLAIWGLASWSRRRGSSRMASATGSLGRLAGVIVGVAWLLWFPTRWL